jgi:hypothetical protein
MHVLQAPLVQIGRQTAMYRQRYWVICRRRLVDLLLLLLVVVSQQGQQQQQQQQHIQLYP